MGPPQHILFDEALAKSRNDESCLQTIADDEEINQFEKQIDQDGIDLLLRFQPVASDLRPRHRSDETVAESGTHWR